MTGETRLMVDYRAAVQRARRDRPADCTCDGLHTSEAYLEPVILDRLIEQERAFGCCPAELRALERIAARLH